MAKQSFGIEYDNAVKRGRRETSTEPRAKRAFYDCSPRQIIVELTNKTKFVFPCDVAQGLARAKDEDLEVIEISPSGTGLHWPALDVDFSLSGLMRGIFGTESWMRSLRVRARKKKGTTTKGSPPAARRRH